jgi:hypothetical protein
VDGSRPTERASRLGKDRQVGVQPAAVREGDFDEIIVLTLARGGRGTSVTAEGA